MSVCLRQSPPTSVCSAQRLLIPLAHHRHFILSTPPPSPPPFLNTVDRSQTHLRVCITLPTPTTVSLRAGSSWTCSLLWQSSTPHQANATCCHSEKRQSRPGSTAHATSVHHPSQIQQRRCRCSAQRTPLACTPSASPSSCCVHTTLFPLLPTTGHRRVRVRVGVRVRVRVGLWVLQLLMPPSSTLPATPSRVLSSGTTEGARTLLKQWQQQ